VADVSAIEDYMGALRKSGDSCGARLRVTAQHVPVGLGEPIYDRLDADIAHALMGLNAVKGVEIGDGFASVAHRGSMHGDSLRPGGGLPATTTAACWAASAAGRTWRWPLPSSPPARSWCRANRST
jgi:chorismate synthase